MTRARGLRRDAPILLPASLLLLALLASVTLLSYRAAVARFAAERSQATLKLAVGLAEAARMAKGDDAGVLARWLPPGGALAIHDGRGGLRATLGAAGAELAAPPAARLAALTVPHVEGLDQPSGERQIAAREAAPDRLRAYVPYERSGQRFVLRLEVPEPALAAQQRSLRILTPVVFGLSAAVALLAIFFLRALVRPYEELLEKARAVAPAGGSAAGPEGAEGRGDDVEFLLATFDRALAALRTQDGRNESGPSEALDELSAVERALGPQLESGLLMFDRAGGLLAANPAALELLGGGSVPAGPVTAAGAAGAAGASGASGASGAGMAARALAAHPELAALVSSAIAEGRSIPRASVAIQRDGHRVELGLTLQALRRGGSGEAGPSPIASASANRRAPTTASSPDVAGAGFLVLFADVTDLSRRESEERFAAGLAQLGELSAGVAHELRNSLATVQGYLGLAARRELPPEAREEIAEARREAAELARIVDDFLTFARPGSGQLEPVDLVALLARAVSDPGIGAGGGGVAGVAGVSVELASAATAEPRLPTIAGDPHLLQRALRNLLLNAAQATLAHAGDRQACAPIVVALRREGAAAVITIDDRGGGVAPEIRDRLFEPFASGRPGGAGLGLALARRIVVMHGGSLALLPREPHGVRAEIRLPLGGLDTKGNA